MKLMDLLNEGEGKRPLSNEVKKHFLEIVSTYNKYQEMMDRKSDIAEIAETLGGITEAAKTLAIHEGDDWFDKHTIKRNMSELDKLGKAFDKCAVEAKSLDQRLNGLYEDMGHILSRYYKMGEISEEQMRERLGMNESVNEENHQVQLSPKGNHIVNIREEEDEIDTITMDVPLFIRALEFAKEDAQTDMDLHDFAEKAIELSKEHDVITMDSYNTLVGSEESVEESQLIRLGEAVQKLMEKNCPTDASKWSYYKGQAKKKFDVYPSAYANGWAAKQYKAAGGSWKQCSNESVNESASRTAVEIGGLTGMNKDAIQKFVDSNELNIEKVYQFVKKGKLSDRMDLVSAIAGKPGNSIQKKMIKMFKESVNEDKNQIKDLVKTTKHEKLFYDVLSTMEKKYGKSNYGKWLDKSLKDFGENPSKYRTSADKEEKLFQLGSK